MNSGLRLHLVEPQPRLRARLVESLRLAGADVSFGEPETEVPDGACIVVNVDAVSPDWPRRVAPLVSGHGGRLVVTSSAATDQTSPTPVSRQSARLTRPFTPAELLEFVAEVLTSPVSVDAVDAEGTVATQFDRDEVSPSDAITVRSDDAAEAAAQTLDAEFKEQGDASVREARTSASPVTEVEVDSVFHVRDLIVSAYVDTFDAMLPTLVDQKVEERSAAIRALLVRFADELSVPND